METLYNWTATRSGASITVHGQLASGAPHRLVGVDSIHPNAGQVFAQRGPGGDRWRLSLDPLPSPAVPDAVDTIYGALAGSPSPDAARMRSHFEGPHQ